MKCDVAFTFQIREPRRTPFRNVWNKRDRPSKATPRILGASAHGVLLSVLESLLLSLTHDLIPKIINGGQLQAAVHTFFTLLISLIHSSSQRLSTANGFASVGPCLQHMYATITNSLSWGPQRRLSNPTFPIHISLSVPPTSSATSLPCTHPSLSPSPFLLGGPFDQKGLFLNSHVGQWTENLFFTCLVPYI